MQAGTTDSGNPMAPGLKTGSVVVNDAISRAAIFKIKLKNYKTIQLLGEQLRADAAQTHSDRNAAHH